MVVYGCLYTLFGLGFKYVSGLNAAAFRPYPLGEEGNVAFQAVQEAQLQTTGILGAGELSGDKGACIGFFVGFEVSFGGVWMHCST